MKVWGDGHPQAMLRWWGFRRWTGGGRETQWGEGSRAGLSGGVQDGVGEAAGGEGGRADGGGGRASAASWT